MNTNGHREKTTFGGRRSFGWVVNHSQVIKTLTEYVLYRVGRASWDGSGSTEIKQEMWKSNESAKKAANGTHLSICVDNFQFDEDKDETARLKIMSKGLAHAAPEAHHRRRPECPPCARSA